MRNLFVALAVSGLLLIPTQKAFGQTANQQQFRTQALVESATANASLNALVQTYKQLLERESGITPEEKRQIANAIDEGASSIPELVRTVNEVYTRFRGDRVFVGASLGVGGEFNFFQNKGVPLLGRTPLLKEWSTGADASVGVAVALIRNDVDGMIFPDFSGYYSVGLNEARANLPPGTSKAAATRAVKTADRLQAYVVWRIYLVPRNMLTSIGVMSASADPDRTPAHVGALGGTYLGGGTEHKWRLTANAVSLQTQVYGRWSLPDSRETDEVLKSLAPEVIMIQLAPSTKIPGRAAPVFAAQGGVQYLGFFGLHGL